MSTLSGVLRSKIYQSATRRTVVSHRIQCRPLSLAYHLYQEHEKTSDQAPVIILHGLFGSKQNNRSISKALSRSLKTDVYAVDLRNHGDSPHHAVHDYTSMAADIEEFMDTHGLQKPIIIGHSMGAKTAMTVALRSPSRVGTLIPVDNAPVDAVLKSDFGKYLQGMRKIIDSRVSKQGEADKVLEEYEPNVAIRQFLLTNIIRDKNTKKLKFRIPINILGAALDQMGAFPFDDPGSVRYDGPTLIIRGTKSHYVPDDVLPLVGRFFPRFEIRGIDSGHWVISEKPGPFKDAVVEFLTSKD